MAQSNKPSPPAQPGYEVEFIPLERRLSDRRRADNASDTSKLNLVIPVDRRKQDRRKG